MLNSIKRYFQRVISRILRILLVERSWTTVKGITNLPVVKLTILVPIFGYLILFNDSLNSYFGLSPEYVTVNADSNSKKFSLLNTINSTNYRLYSYYFGLTFLAFGVFIYLRCCPRRIKRYDSLQQLINEETLYLSHYDLSRLLDQAAKHDRYEFEKNSDIKDLSKFISNANRIIHNFRGNESTIGERDKSKLKDIAIDLLKSLWLFENQDKSRMIKLSLLFFSIGFLILLVPTVTIFIDVILSITR